MSSECVFCLWLAELPAPLQMTLGVIFIVLVAPAVFGILAVTTTRIDEAIDRCLGEPPSEPDISADHGTLDRSDVAQEQAPRVREPVKLSPVPRAGFSAKESAK